MDLDSGEFKRILKDTVTRCLNDHGTKQDAKGLANVVISLLHERDEILKANRENKRIIQEFEKNIKNGNFVKKYFK